MSKRADALNSVKVGVSHKKRRKLIRNLNNRKKE